MRSHIIAVFINKCSFVCTLKDIFSPYIVATESDDFLRLKKENFPKLKKAPYIQDGEKGKEFGFSCKKFKFVKYDEENIG